MPKLETGPHLDVKEVSWLHAGHRFDETQVNRALSLVADAGLVEVDAVTGRSHIRPGRTLPKEPRKEWSVTCPVGTHAQFRDREGLIMVELDPGCFLLSKRALRWRTFKTLLVCLVCGGAVGWGLPTGLKKVGEWQAQRAAARVYAESHYSIGWLCGNCNHSSLPQGEGRMHLDLVKGQLVEDVLADSPCPVCGAVGQLSGR